MGDCKANAGPRNDIRIQIDHGAAGGWVYEQGFESDGENEARAKPDCYVGLAGRSASTDIQSTEDRGDFGQLESYECCEYYYSDECDDDGPQDRDTDSMRDHVDEDAREDEVIPKNGMSSCGVELDDGRSMEEVYGNAEIFYGRVVKAGECSYHRPEDGKWSSKLRFLTPFDKPEALQTARLSTMRICGEIRKTSKAPPSPAAPCCNFRGYRSFTGSETKRLRLTDLGEITECPHYVAVSYVWNSWPREDDVDEYQVVSAIVTRASRAASKLIGWAVDYAAYWSMPFIWIDQECIEQSESEEKQAHINDMDRIFRCAAKVIAPLTTSINRPIQLRVADDLLGWYYGIEKRPHIDLIRALGSRLLSDDWFTRAWILQENMSISSRRDSHQRTRSPHAYSNHQHPLRRFSISALPHNRSYFNPRPCKQLHRLDPVTPQNAPALVVCCQ